MPRRTRFREGVRASSGPKTPIYLICDRLWTGSAGRGPSPHRLRYPKRVPQSLPGGPGRPGSRAVPRIFPQRQKTTFFRWFCGDLPGLARFGPGVALFGGSQLGLPRLRPGVWLKPRLRATKEKSTLQMCQIRTPGGPPMFAGFNFEGIAASHHRSGVF